MDPSNCYNPKFKIPETEKNIEENITKKDLSERLKEVEDSLRDNFSKRGPLDPPLIIENESKCTLIVKEYRENGNSYFLIYRNFSGVESPVIKIPFDRFHHVHFINIRDCRIFIETKLVRIFLYECLNCQVSVTETTLGMVELYKCKNINLSLSTWIPWVRIENCDTIKLFQSSDEIIYVVKMSCNVSGTIIDRKTKERLFQYEMGKLIWNEAEQILICLSREKGFMVFPSKYILNDISHHLIAP